MSWDKERIAQIQLPDPADDDPHPRLLLEGYGIHAGQGFTALFPDGWHEITLEVAWEPTGPACWYISTPGFDGVCPVGQMCIRDRLYNGYNKSERSCYLWQIQILTFVWTQT